MATLTKASRELFRRSPDERFDSFDGLLASCRNRRYEAEELWTNSLQFDGNIDESSHVRVSVDGSPFRLNDWSFGQICRLCGVSKDTVNRLTPATATKVLRETLPSLRKPFQVYSADGAARAIHGTAYTRLYDEEVLDVVREFKDEFSPPLKGMSGGTGLYAGEQDMFCFLIDESSRVEIRGESFAPGMFLWNSEVGKRSVGISTFWFQHICQNHIVWDAIDVVEITRKHTANVHRTLDEIRSAVDQLMEVRNERVDAFSRTIERAMDFNLADADEVQSLLKDHGIPRNIIQQAVAIDQTQTVFGLVDAITRIAGQIANAGDRLQLDAKAASLLSLAA